MPEMSNDIFVWIPREQTTKYVIKIDGTDVTDDVVSSEFSMASTEEVGRCKINLENSTDIYTDLYKGDEDIEFYLDFQTGETLRFKGNVEKRNIIFKEGQYILEISGRHISGKLIDEAITASYSDTEIADILKGIIDNFASEFTYTNVEDAGITANVNWENKPFWECVIDLCNLAGFECYVDNDADFHFFQQGSILNTDEAIVWNDNMIDISGLAEDILDVFNKVTVRGEDDEGIPIIYTSENITSQSDIGIKEKVIIDSKITSMSEAKEIADATLTTSQHLSGETTSGILPSVNPGEKIWIDNPFQRIRNQYIITKFTHKIPLEETVCIVRKETTVPKIFRDRIQKEIDLEVQKNPNAMTYSYNFPFDNADNILDGIPGDYLELVGGALQLKTGQDDGTLITNTHPANTSGDISKVELRMVSEGSVTVTFTTDGVNYQSIETNTETTPGASGSDLQMKIVLSRTAGEPTPKVLSLAMLYK